MSTDSTTGSDILRHFSNSVEADLARTRLQADGIHATVQKTSRYRAMSGGGYILRVPHHEIAHAQEIIGPINRAIDMDEYVDANDESYRRCPKCRSVNVEVVPLTPGQRRTVLMTLGLAFPFVKRCHVCTRCSVEW
ncbi:MAG: hypothetical protein AAB353_09195 [Candidatus Hydrogenedentota bacterium]